MPRSSAPPGAFPRMSCPAPPVPAAREVTTHAVAAGAACRRGDAPPGHGPVAVHPLAAAGVADGRLDHRPHRLLRLGAARHPEAQARKGQVTSAMPNKTTRRRPRRSSRFAVLLLALLMVLSSAGTYLAVEGFTTRATTIEGGRWCCAHGPFERARYRSPT